MAPTFTQIQRWLKKPEVWRFVGFASTVVGLLCYALSSSFNHLIGGWNLLKIILYSVFSLIICVAVLFARAWQHSPSPRFKAHMAFLILTITSIYSFFYDNRVSRKPDAYSLISCAAFAMMSLSLSRQRHTVCGFEVDLLYFFLGFLIMQLMKIKLLLGIVGAGFSYFLIIFGSSSDAPVESADLRLRDQNYLAIEMGLLHSNNGGGALLLTTQQANTGSTPIRNSFHAPPPNNSDVTMPRFMDILDEIRKTNPSVVNKICKDRVVRRDPNYVVDMLPLSLIDDLSENVKLMVADGFEKKCLDEYSRWRREFLKECLLGFGLNELNSKEVDEKERIRRWIELSDIAFWILFPCERRLCDRIFSGFSSAANLTFMQVCSKVMSNLLNFANAFVNGSPSVNLLPGILRVFRKLHDLLPELESVFSDQYTASFTTNAFYTSQRLSEASRHLFIKLENLIRRDISQGGPFAPITEEVREYLSAVAEEVSSSHSAELTRIVELLDSHLDAKFKDYTELARGLGHKAIQDKLKILLNLYTITENREHNERSTWVSVKPIATAMEIHMKHNRQVCPICLTSEKDLAFGFGHMVCGDCGSRLTNCPICRGMITNRLRLQCCTNCGIKIMYIS